MACSTHASNMSLILCGCSSDCCPWVWGAAVQSLGVSEHLCETWSGVRQSLTWPELSRPASNLHVYTEHSLTAAGLTAAGVNPTGLTPAGLTAAGLTIAGLTAAGLTAAGSMQMSVSQTVFGLYMLV